MATLTAVGIRALQTGKVAGRHGDGGGLFLIVSDTGSANWVLRKQVAGNRRDIGLGSASAVSLKAARAAAEIARAQLAAGIDPVAARAPDRDMPTFRQAAALVHGEHKGGWRNAKHKGQWLSTLEAYAFPTIGDLPVSNVTAAQVRDLLAVIWLGKHATATRVRQRVCAVLDWAHGKGYREFEAPLRSISVGLPRVSAKAGHHAALPFADMAAFMARLRSRQSMGRLALEAAILTAARSGEVRGMVWSEVDLEGALWTIPATRMKGGRDHVVPLSPAALAVIRRAKAMPTATENLVFPGTKCGRPVSDMTLLKVLRDMDAGCTVHGFRSAFKDWAGEEAGFANELSEAALAHAIANKTEAAYRRGSLLERRRAMMAAWGDWCDGGRGVPLRAVG